MAIEKKSLVRDSDGLVVNIIVYNPDNDWQPPEGHTVRELGPIGGTWDGTKIIPPPEPPRPTLDADDLGALVDREVGNRKALLANSLLGAAASRHTVADALNRQMREAMRLLNKKLDNQADSRNPALTDEEKQKLVDWEALDDAVTALEQKADTLKTRDPATTDVTAEEHWITG